MVTSKNVEELYNYYLTNGEGDSTWYFILKRIKPLVDCRMRMSHLFYSLYDDSLPEIQLAVVNAFRTYNKDSKASIFTWTTRLINQAIWRYIRDRQDGDFITYNSDENDFTEYEEQTAINTVEEDIEKREIEDENIKQIKSILNNVIRNNIYAEVYCAHKGILGYEKTEEAQLPEKLGMTKKTVTQAIVDNRIRIACLKKYVAKYNSLPTSKEQFLSFMKNNNQ